MKRAACCRTILLATTALTMTSTAFADDAAERQITLDTITVTSTKTETSVYDALSASSVVGETEIERTRAERISEILSGVPGVNVSEDADDPGSSINIRGLQDFGRVNVMIDGARQNFQRSGHGSNGSFYLDPALVQRVDITRGPVSTIFGSGAIGGVVNFELKNARDILEPEETWAFITKTGYSTNGDAVLVSATGAAQPTENIGVMGNVVWRDDNDYTDGSGDRVPGSANEVVSALVKGNFTVGNDNEFELGYLRQNHDYTTKSISSGGALTARDTETIDDTATLKWKYNPESDLVDWSFSSYVTSTDSDQKLLSGSGTVGSERNFKITTVGTDFHNTSRFNTGSVAHAITIGGDLFHDTVKVEEGDPIGSSDEFTPNGKRLAYGAFIQDEVDLTNWLKFIGALRFDGYELKGNGNKSSGTRISPKATIGVTPVKGVQFYATYAEGYRSPAVTEAFNSGTHPVPPTFTISPNPNLKPETARNYEAGVNLKFDDVLSDGDAFRAKASIFRNDVSDYIDAYLTGFNPATCFGPPFNGCGTFQYQNISKARLEGVELEAFYDAGRYFAGVSYTRVRGDDLEADVPLISVYPDKLVTTAGVRFLDERLTVGGKWTIVDAQNRLPGTDRTGSVVVPQGSHDPVDLFMSYEHNRSFSTTLTLKNIFDENYTQYLNLDPSPGFSAGLTATIRLGG